MNLTRPHQLPEFRLWLMKQWIEGVGFFWMVAESTKHMVRLPHQEWIPFEAAFDSRALPPAQLYWVTAEMCALIDKASRTLPPTTLVPELNPDGSEPTLWAFFVDDEREANLWGDTMQADAIEEATR